MVRTASRTAALLMGLIIAHVGFTAAAQVFTGIGWEDDIACGARGGDNVCRCSTANPQHTKIARFRNP